MVYRYCIVPGCKSTTITTPEKTFIKLPIEEKRRKIWLKAISRQSEDISSKSNVYLCDDHFSLEHDMENYMEWKMMGVQKRMKKNVVPHIFACQEDRKRTRAKPERLGVVKRAKRNVIQDVLCEASTSKSGLPLDLPTQQEFTPALSNIEGNVEKLRTIGVQLPNDMENYMQYRIRGFIKQIRMKKGCLPSKFACQQDGEKEAVDDVSAMVIKEQKIKLVEGELEETTENEISFSTNSPVRCKLDLDESMEVKQELLDPIQEYKIDIEEHFLLNENQAFFDGASKDCDFIKSEVFEQSEKSFNVAVEVKEEPQDPIEEYNIDNKEHFYSNEDIWNHHTSNAVKKESISIKCEEEGDLGTDHLEQACIGSESEIDQAVVDGYFVKIENFEPTEEVLFAIQIGEEVKKPSYKYCMVPKCKNTNISTPDKLFFRIPRDAKLREKWCKMMRRDNVAPLSVLFCCEDHFNVEEDTINYIQYNIMKQKGEKCSLRLKKGVVPHIFLCQNRNKQPPVERMAVAKRKRLALVNEALSGYAMKSSNTLEIGEPPQKSDYEASLTNLCDINQAGPSTSRIEVCDVRKTESSTSCTEDKMKCDKAVQVNIKPKYRSRGVNVNIPTKKKNVALSTFPLSTHNIGTSPKKVSVLKRK